MELYYYPLSMNSQKVRLVLEEKKLGCTMVVVDTLCGANLEPDFMKLNANGTVPVLRDGDRIMADSKTIIEYLDQIGQPLGRTAVDRARVADWVQRVSSWNDQMFTYGNIPKNQALSMTKFKRRMCIARMAKNPSLGPAYSTRLSFYQNLEQEMQDGQSVHTAKERLVAMLNTAERDLGLGLFLAGQEMSIADACFLPVLARIEYLGMQRELIRPRPQVFEYLKRMRRRPSYRKVVSHYSSGFTYMSIVYPTHVTLTCRKLLRRY